MLVYAVKMGFYWSYSTYYATLILLCRVAVEGGFSRTTLDLTKSVMVWNSHVAIAYFLLDATGLDDASLMTQARMVIVHLLPLLGSASTLKAFPFSTMLQEVYLVAPYQKLSPNLKT